MTTRRALLRTASWAAPFAVVALAAPALAVSVQRDVLVFTNLTATAGKGARVIYVNTKVMTTEGQEVPGLVVTISIKGDARATEYALKPWGATDLIKHEFHDQPAEGAITVNFHAEAPGIEPIMGQVVVNAPSWWKEAKR